MATETTPIRLPDSPAPFREWLAGLEPGYAFAWVEDSWCRGCPIASYLRAMGAESPSANGSTYRSCWQDEVDGRPELPHWGRVFVFEYDSSSGEGCGTAALALRVIDEVIARLEVSP